MNYFNPYFSSMPYSYTPTTTASRGLLGSLLGGGKLSAIINGTQKTLGIINQAIPIVKQMNPVIKNAKTMFKVMNEFKRIDKVNNPSNTINNTKDNSVSNVLTEPKIAENNQKTYQNGPTFFL